MQRSGRKERQNRKIQEEKWGPQVNSLYLQNKDEFDYVVYHELKSAKTNTLQEIYFRIKDKETTWETLREPTEHQ